MGGSAVAVVGCGYWGKNLVRNFHDLGALAWICDADPVALARQSESIPGARATTDLGLILADPDVRAVVIASPAALHHAHAQAVLDAGKDVFVEKPLALRLEDGQRLVDAARANSLILMVGHVLEYHPAVASLKTIVASGELGALRYLYSNRLNLGKVRHEENILWSFAPHDISIITSLVGAAPVSVSASGGTYLQHGIPDVTVTNLAFEGEVRAHVFVSWLHPHKEQRLTVVGSSKMAVFDDTLNEGKLRIVDKGIDWEQGRPVTRQRAETTVELEDVEPLRRECEHFLHCVESRTEPLTGAENAMRVLSVLAASQLSLDLGGVPVSLNRTDEDAAVA
jgi:UDP-2-acetamido-3-amino-2,3-dideoxy-glucuronate N-acetyltransferase